MSLEEIAEEIRLSYPIRTDILAYSLLIETATSSYLGALIGIKDLENSKSFGNKSSALSFNQKVNLLLDIDALVKEDIPKYMAFMEIRNQFIHNSKANTYEKCLSYLPGKDKYLLKTYPQEDILEKEEQYKIAIASLAKDVFRLTTDLGDKVLTKINLEAEGKTNTVSFEAVRLAIEDVEKTINNIFDQAQEPLELKDYIGFGHKVQGLIWRRATEIFKELTKTVTKSSQ